MTILEKKVDALIRLYLTDDPHEQEKLKKKLQELLSGKRMVGTVREEAAALLTEIGVSSHLQGYAYALEAICIAVEEPDLAVFGNIAKLWRKTAQLFEVEPSSIERCIRHATERCFDNCDQDLIVRYFGCTVSSNKGKLTCGEFIAGCAKLIRERIEERG